MRAKELMIGDKVVAKRIECVGDGGQYQEWMEFGEIIRILEDTVYVMFDKQKDDWEEIDIKDIESIPLTVEILEKNEFEKVLDEDNTECYRYFSSAADGYIKITLWDGGDSDWSLEVVNYEKFDNNEIIYQNNFTFLKVHELQNALRLCGIEKEIIL